MLDTLHLDWRTARRSLAQGRITTVAALATITVTVGLATAVFSLVSSILLQPLPYPDADRLVRLAEFRRELDPNPKPSGGRLASVTVGLWQQETTLLEAVVPYSVSGRPVGRGGTGEQLIVATVAARFFEMIGARPIVGRLFDAADHSRDSAPVVIVSRRYWTDVLGEQPDALGSVVTVDDLPHTVIGVAPASIAIPAQDIDVWVPGRWRWPLPGARGNMVMMPEVLARMKPGVSVQEVQREGERVVRTIALADPRFADGTVTIPAVRVARLLDDMVLEARPALHALLAGMGLVLAAACASLANLLVARNTARARPIAIRVTLGAGRWRLLQPLALEHLAIAALGTALGAVLAWWMLDALRVIAATSLPRVGDLRFDWRAAALTATVASIITLAAGIAPAWHRRHNLVQPLSGSDRVPVRVVRGSGDRLRVCLVALQVALAVVLLVGSSLIGRSLLRLVHTSPGFQPEGVLTFQVAHPESVWSDRTRLTRFHGELLERIKAIPGVAAAGVAAQLPLKPPVMRGTFRIVGQPPPEDPADRPRASINAVTVDYLRAVRTRVLAGRAFDDSDDQQHPPVVMVDDVLARLYFEGDAIGKRLLSVGGKTWTIIGVLEAVKPASMNDAVEPAIYFPAAQVGEALVYNRVSGGIAVRTSGDPASLVPAIRAYVREIDPQAPMFNVMPLSERLNRTFDLPRFYALALTLFASLTLATALLGVYGIQAHMVERRRSEFGLRRALGADDRDLVRLVLTRAGVVAAAGVAVGLPFAAAGAGLLRSLLFGIRPVDPITFALAGTGIAMLVIASSWPAARRALQIDPAQALRSD